MKTTYIWFMTGTDANGNLWETKGVTECEYHEIFNQANAECFKQLAKRAVYGQPGKGCEGPYTVARVEIYKQYTFLEADNPQK